MSQRSQETPGGAMRTRESNEEPGGARSSQEELKQGVSMQEEPR